MRRHRLVLLAAATGLACVGLAPAAFAADTTGPNLKTARNATFVVGSQIGPMAPDANGPVDTYPIQMTTTWSATDASGMCGFRTRQEFGGGVGSWSPWGGTRSATYATSDYDDQYGGGSQKFVGIDVQARDCVGNTTTNFVRFFPEVFQDNGASYGYGTMPVSYQGTWGISKCACWSGGTTHKTYAAGARASFSLNTDGYPIGAGLVAVVMEKAPGRGKVQIRIDGVLKATVDTYAATARHRTIVWAGYVSSTARTLTLVNVGTPGRSRIDVDAVITSTY